MTDYARVLWLGGGVSYEALDELVSAIEYHIEIKNAGPDQSQWHIKPRVLCELENVANACRAELTKRPDAVCDLI